MTLEEKEFIEDFDPSRLREAAQTQQKIVNDLSSF
jgi:hypothetical protein